MVIFDGKVVAREREELLRQRVVNLGKPVKLVSIYFAEDKTGQLYTRLKGEAAERVGISFQKIECSLTDSLEHIKEQIRNVCADSRVTGMLIQKPPKSIYPQELWEQLVVAIDPDKDADGLNPESGILPATVKAVMTILRITNNELRITGKKIV